jgi:uncharacterized damage-inducible protein DinB
MTPDERRLILDQLEQGTDALKAELESVSAEQAAYRPAPGRWSILDCVEHLALAEPLLLDLIANRSFPSDPAAKGREESYLRHSTNRSRKFNAPGGIHPGGRFPSVDAALRAFWEARDSTQGYLASVDDDLRARKTLHPVAGEITCRECLALLIGHPLRHLEQIREIRDTPGFPG